MRRPSTTRARSVLLQASFLASLVPGLVLAQAIGDTEVAVAALQAHPPTPLASFSVTASDGRTVTPQDFDGRVVLLNFWATWCVPCRVEMPSLEGLQDELGGETFTVVPVSVDRGGQPVVDRFYSEHALDGLDAYFDPRSRAAGTLGVLGLPTSILVDRAGREVGRVHGAIKWDEPAIQALIAELIGNSEAE